MRKFPELNIEWTPAEGADSQLLEVNANGLSPSGSYIYQYLPSHFSEFSVFCLYGTKMVKSGQEKIKLMKSISVLPQLIMLMVMNISLKL